MCKFIGGAVIAILLFTNGILKTQSSKLYDVHGEPVSCKVISLGDFPFHSFCEIKETAHLR